MGASSARTAVGWIAHGAITLKSIEQVPHSAVNGKWNTRLLKSLCDRAVTYAIDNFESATVGIDTWGVDHGFISLKGELIQDPVAYRDPSHSEAFDSMVGHRKRLFELTGVQHQPFNTIYQFAARKRESPHLTDATFQMLPDMFGFLLTSEKNYEATQCSTTQLVASNGEWCHEAFDLVGWRVPDQQPARPGRIVAPIVGQVELASVASHDTASAVCGLGTLGERDLFLNMGTWFLLGTLIDQPLLSPTADDGGWTNERAHDGRIRFLKNIPGFYIVNRLHEELRVESSVAAWLASANLQECARFDYHHRSLYNPPSMLEAVLALLPRQPTNTVEWASVALNSMVGGMTSQPTQLGEITNRQFERIRVSGGGSQSALICQGISDATGLKVVAGPPESTVLGNIAMQLVARGEVNISDLARLIDASIETSVYFPR